MMLSTLIAGCNTVTWYCVAACADPPDRGGSKAYQLETPAMAQNQCAVDFGPPKCTRGFYCLCTDD